MLNGRKESRVIKMSPQTGRNEMQRHQEHRTRTVTCIFLSFVHIKDYTCSSLLECKRSGFIRSVYFINGFNFLLPLHLTMKTIFISLKRLNPPSSAFKLAPAGKRKDLY